MVWSAQYDFKDLLVLDPTLSVTCSAILRASNIKNRPVFPVGIPAVNIQAAWTPSIGGDHDLLDRCSLVSIDIVEAHVVPRTVQSAVAARLGAHGGNCDADKREGCCKEGFHDETGRSRKTALRRTSAPRSVQRAVIPSGARPEPKRGPEHCPSLSIANRNHSQLR